MAVRAWVSFRHWGGPPARTEVLTQLRTAEVEVVSAEHAPAMHAVVLFSAVTPELVLDIHDVSLGGVRPVLAVAANSQLLGDNLAWQLLGAGASDVLAWDSCNDAADDIRARLERVDAIEALQGLPHVRDRLVGDSAAWRAVLRQVVEVAHFTAAPVLITGDSGTGKELLAHMIHALDPRPDRGDFVVVDCTTVVPTLSGSEFFGHERGAFTGAVAARDGAFATADRGTLFLDEVGELPLTLQAELLRVIQEGMYKRVGSNTWRRTTFRLVSATNRDLLQAAADGKFRQDLYYRLAGWSFRSPALSERRSDIPALARHFLAELYPGQPPPELAQSVAELLMQRDYPGNVRDLRQLVARIATRHVGGGPITVGDVPRQDRPAAASAAGDGVDFEPAVRAALGRGLTLKDVTQLAADTAVRVAMHDELWNVKRAAARLGVTDRALQLRRAAARTPQ